MSNIIEFFRSRILQKKNLFAFVCAAIFIFLFLSFIPFFKSSSSGYLRVCFESDREGNAQCFFAKNNEPLSEKNSVLRKVNKGINVIKFKIPNDWDVLRFDPIDTADCKLVIHSMVVNKKRKVFTLPKEKLASLNADNLSPSADNFGKPALSSTTVDPMIWIDLEDFEQSRINQGQIIYSVALFIFLLFTIAVIRFLRRPDVSEICIAHRWCVAFLTVLFFIVPITTSVDSTVYCSYVPILNGDIDFSCWNSIRSWGFPAFIKFATDIFGYNIYGMTCAYFILYILCYIFSLYLIKTFLKDSSSQLVKVSMWCFSIIFAISYIITGYFHVLLTEAVAVTAILGGFCLLFSIRKNNIEKSLLLGLTVLFLTSLKASFAIVLLSSSLILSIIRIFEISHIAALSFKKKAICALKYSACVFLIPLIILGIGENLWKRQFGKGHDSKVAYRYGYSRFVFGISNAKLSAQYPEGKVNVDIFNASHTSKLDSFVFDFQSGRPKDALRFLWTTFKRNPSAVLTGYLNNFLTMTNYYHLRHDRLCIYPDIDRKFSVGEAAENMTLAFAAMHARLLVDPDFMYTIYCKEIVFGLRDVNLPSLYVKLWRKTRRPMNVFFTTIMLAAPLLLIAVCFYPWCKKKKFFLVLSGAVNATLLMNILFNAIIDRYLFQVFILQILCVGIWLVMTWELIEKKKLVNKKL